MPATVTNLGPCECCGEPTGCGCPSVRTATTLYVSGSCTGTLTGPAGGPWEGVVNCGTGCTALRVCVACAAAPPTGTCSDYSVELKCNSCGGPAIETCADCTPPPAACSCGPFQLNRKCCPFNGLFCCINVNIDIAITL